MAKTTEGKTTRSRPILLVGAGRKPKELGACLAAVDSVRAQLDGEDSEPGRTLGLGDLEELLSKRPPTGTLILDYERVPGEDIGFVRRFLERHAGWQLVVLGPDARDARARGLLALPRADWLNWPPDLDQIGALLEQVNPRPDSLARRGQAGTKTRRRAAAQPETTREELDVGNLLEELLAGSSLGGDGAPRYLYRCDDKLLVHRERAPLAEGLTALLLLSRRCAGEDGVVSTLADLAPGDGDPADTVRIRIEFPTGPLREEDLSGLLSEPFAGAAELAEDVERARQGAAALRAQGCRVDLAARREDRLRFDLFLASSPLQATVPASGPGEVAGKAEDPFA